MFLKEISPYSTEKRDQTQIKKSRWGSALGVTQILVFLDTNMLVSLTRNCDVGESKPT